MTRVLITRPADEADALAKRVEAMGFVPVIEPLISICALPGAKVDAFDIQAVVFTSANGVRALATASGGESVSRTLPVFAVGTATAAAARAAGFQDVHEGQGTVEDLARVIAGNLPAQRGPILHVSGSVVARDLAPLLAASRHTVRRAVLYESVPAAALRSGTRRQIEAGAVGAALFFSPRTARTFVTLIEASRLQGAMRSIVSFGLSAAVSDALTSLPFARVVTAARPTTDALLESLLGAGLTNA
ncbi:MAG: uroporphyrinogen-III synthase [Gemmatimonas sp.]